MKYRAEGPGKWIMRSSLSDSQSILKELAKDTAWLDRELTRVLESARIKMEIAECLESLQ